MTDTTPRLKQRLDTIQLDPDTFKTLGHALVDQIAELFQQLPSRPVTTQASPETIREKIRAIASTDNGQDAGKLLEKTSHLLLEHSLFNGHPKFWGYITSSPAPLGVLGDLLASAVNANVGAYALSPVATEIEKQTIDWIGRFMGYPAGGGLLVSGGNMANNVGFLAALRAATGSAARKSGLRKLPSNLVVYCSAETHTWVQKATDLYGLGTDSIRWIASDETGQMDTALLEATIQADRAAGHQPFLVIGTAGSVSTGVVDPLNQLAAICKKQDLWFHVDGAYGSLAAALPELKAHFAGLEAADSVAVDPHKWLYAPLEAGCVLVKNTRHLTDAFSYRPPYFNFEQAELNYIDYGPQNSRGFRALKVWLSAQHLGINGHRQLIREDIRLAQVAYDTFKNLDDFEVFSCNLSITTFRYVPSELKQQLGNAQTEIYLNELNQAILKRIETGGVCFLSNAVIQGKFVLRMCVVNFRTTTEDIESLAAYIRKLGETIREAEN